MMRRQGSGRIINVSSVVGHVAPPYAGVYAASKFALEELSEEVRPFGVSVSLIEPSFVKTRIASQQPTTPIAAYSAGRQAAMQVLSASVASAMEPGAVARVILRAATAWPRLRYLVGRDAKALMLLNRLLPEPLLERVQRCVFRVGNSLNLSPRLNRKKQPFRTENKELLTVLR